MSGSCERAKKKKKKTVTKMTLIRIGFGAFRTVQGSGKQNGGMVIRRILKTMQITALLKSVRILKRILETSDDMLPLRRHRKTIC